MLGCGHLDLDPGKQERRSRHDLRPEVREGQEILVALVVPVGDAGAPGDKERHGEDERNGGGHDRDGLAAPREGHARDQQSPEGERCPLVFGQHGGTEKQPRSDSVGEPGARPDEQQEGAAVEAGERQIAVGAHRSPTRVVREEWEERGREHGERRRVARDPAPRAAVDESEENREEHGVERPVDGVGILSQREQLGESHLGERQEQRIARMGDVPLRLPERPGVDRSLGMDIARLNDPGHAAVPVQQGIGESLCKDAQADQGGDGEGRFLETGPRPAFPRRRARRRAGAFPDPGHDPGEDGSDQHGEHGRPPQRDGEDVRKGVEAPADPGDPQQIAVCEPLAARKGGDPGEELDDSQPRHGEEGRSEKARQGVSRGHAGGSAPGGSLRAS